MLAEILVTAGVRQQARSSQCPHSCYVERNVSFWPETSCFAGQPDSLQPAEEWVLHFSSHRNRKLLSWNLSAALKLSVTCTQAVAESLAKLDGWKACTLVSNHVLFMKMFPLLLFLELAVCILFFFLLSKLLSGNMAPLLIFIDITNFWDLCTESAMKWRSRLGSQSTSACAFQIRKWRKIRSLG